MAVRRVTASQKISRPFLASSPPEEHQLPGLDPIAVSVSGPLLFHVQVLEINDVRLHEGTAGRETVALSLHEGEQVGAATDDDIGKLDHPPLGIHAAQLRFIAEGQHSVVTIPDPGRRGLHQKQRALERKTLPLGKQSVVDPSAPLGCMHDVVGPLAHQPAMELVHLPLPARRRADQFGRLRRQRNEPDIQAPIELHPMPYGLVLALHALEIEHGDLVTIADQGPCQMIVGRSNAAVAYRTEYLLGRDADPKASPR